MEDLTLRLKYWSSLTALLLIFACTKEHQHLVPKSRDGRNTLGYELDNGELVGGELDEQDSHFVDENGRLIIEHHFSYLKNMYETSYSHNLSLFFVPDSVTGEFYFSDAEYREGDEDYKLNTLAANAMSIDYQNASQRIVAGTFELNFFYAIDAVVDDSTIIVDTIYTRRLENGRFDVSY